MFSRKSSFRTTRPNTKRTPRNSLSDFALLQSKNDNQKSAQSSEVDIGLSSRRFRSSAATGGRAKSPEIDRDKRVGRKRRSKSSALSPIRKKSTMCIPTSDSRESCNGAAIASGADGMTTLSNISEIDGRISARRCFRSSKRANMRSEEVHDSY